MKRVIYSWSNQRLPGIPGKQHWGTREWCRYKERQARQKKKHEEQRARRKKKPDSEEITISINLWTVLRGAFNGAAFLTLVILSLLGNKLATLLVTICAVWYCWDGKSAS